MCRSAGNSLKFLFEKTESGKIEQLTPAFLRSSKSATIFTAVLGLIIFVTPSEARIMNREPDLFRSWTSTSGSGDTYKHILIKVFYQTNLYYHLFGYTHHKLFCFSVPTPQITQAPSNGQKWNFVQFGRSAHRTRVGNLWPLPNDTIHAGLCHYGTTRKFNSSSFFHTFRFVIFS